MASHSARRAKIPVRPKGSDKCPHHRGMDLLYHCLTCDELACTDCVFSTHQGHKLDSLEHIIPHKKDKIEEYVKKAERRLLPQYKSGLQSIDAKIKENGDHFQGLISDIQNRGKLLKKEIDQLTKKLVGICKSMETENLKILSQYKEELERLHTDLKDQINQSKIALNQGTNVDVYDIERNIKLMPSVPQVPTVKYTEFQVPVLLSTQLTKQLEELYGALTHLERQGQRSQGQTPTYDDENASDLVASLRIGNPSKVDESDEDDSSCEEYDSSEEESVEEVSSCGEYDSSEYTRKIDLDEIETIYQLQDQVKFLSAFELMFSSVRCSICITKQNNAWMSLRHNKGHILLLVTPEGQVKNIISPPLARCFGIDSSYKTGNLWLASYQENGVESVIEVVSSKEFKTRMKCEGLISFHVCKDEKIVVVAKHKIVKYDENGKILHELHDKRWVKPHSERHRIDDCPVTGTIAIVQCDILTVLNSKLEILFECKEVKTKDMQTVKFLFRDICYDSQGNLLATDWENKNSVVLLNGKGHLMRTLIKQVSPDFPHTPRFITIDGNDSLWVVGGNAYVMLVKYKD